MALRITFVALGCVLFCGYVIASVLAIPIVFAPADQLDTTNKIASKFGVSIIWTSDWRNCSARGEMSQYSGCWLSITPDVIYVSPGMPQNLEDFIILHETMHVLQHRLGSPIDECEADRFAILNGPKIQGFKSYDCANVMVSK